jgi:UDP:flavonoid glycosyltransferase YjiC (YdhE family)
VYLYIARSCAAHHWSCADSIIEATYAGVPQAILPAWIDLYTLSVRTEWLGCGVRANKGAEPGIDGPQLADTLVRLLRDGEGEEGWRIKKKAVELGTMCRRVRGDRRAADAILKAAEGKSDLS